MKLKSKKKRNIDQDREEFFDAVAASSVEEIPTEFDERSVSALTSNIGVTKIFLLGETHGVKENADVIYTLFKKFGFHNLALEWDVGLKEKVNHFLKTDEFDFSSIQDSTDGRITARYFALFKKLRSEGLLEKLVFFDQKSRDGGWDGRDAAMAKNVLESLSNTPTLVVAGNLHTETSPVTFSTTTEKHHPMGECVRNRIAHVSSGKIEYLTGEFHNYGIRSFSKTHEGMESSIAKFYRSPGGSYVFKLPRAHVATVPNPSKKL